MDTSKDLNKKVDKEEGKKLTSNDFTNQYKAKLDSVQENAQVNVIEEVRVDNVPLTITGKAVNISLNLSDYVTRSELANELSGKEDVANKINSLTSAATHIQYASAKATFDFVNEKLSNVYKYQGSRTIAQLNALVVDASMNGFVYNVSDSGTLTNGNVAVNVGDNVSIVWNEQTSTFSWDKLASTFTVDLSNYYTKPETNALLNAKANSADVYSKTDTDARYGRKASRNIWEGTNTFRGLVTFEYGAAFTNDFSRVLFGENKMSFNSAYRIFNVGNTVHYSVPYSTAQGNVNEFTLATTDMLSDYATLQDVEDATEVIITTQAHLSDYENENGLNKIIRIRDAQGNVKDTYVIDKIVTPSTLVIANADTSEYENGETFDGDLIGIFENIQDILGDNFALDASYSDYIVNYNQDDETTYGMRFGDNSYGYVNLHCEPNKVIRVIVGKYFEYNGQGEKVFDEHCAIFSDCFAENPEIEFREITEERQVFELRTKGDGYLYFDSDGSNLGFGDTRFILYGFETGEAASAEYQAREIGTSSGGGTSEQMPIDINILEMKIIQDDQAHNPNAPDGRCLYDYIQDDSDGRCNDPRYAYLHIKSSFIDSYAEEQIEAGNFIIRFDYSTKYKKTSHKLKGDGRYSFLPNFYDPLADDMLPKMPVLERSFIYIDTNDIKTDAQGRKFIYKKIPITDLVNALWNTELQIEEEEPEHPRFSDEFFEYEQGDLNGVRVGGAVQTHFDTFGSEGVSRLRDSGSNKYFATTFTLNGWNINNEKNPFKSPNKDIPLLHYWCPFLLPAGAEAYTQFARSFYSRSGWGIGKPHRKFMDEAVTKPRFAVLDPNYDTITEGSIWIKKYPQYNKRLYCYPGQMFPELFEIDGENQDIWIFRFGISK